MAGKACREICDPCCDACECKDPPLLLRLTCEEATVQCPNPKCGHIGIIAIKDVKGEWNFRTVSETQQSESSR